MDIPELPPLQGPVFLSSRDSMAFYDVKRDGTVALYDEYDYTHHQIPVLLKLEAGAWQWRDGYLPILAVGTRYELFAVGDELFVRDGTACTAYPGGRAVAREEFEAEAAKLAAFWNQWIDEGLVLPPISPRADAAWRSSLIQARCAFAGRHPFYGAFNYRRYCHASFPPSVLSLCETLLQYRHVQEATEIFLYYCKRFVFPDGRFDYYGPSIAEYGAFMWLGAMFLKAVPQRCEELAAQLFPVVRQVLSMFDRLDIPRNPEEAGLLCGSPEADERHKVAIYYHNNCQVLLGLRQLAPEMRLAGWPELDNEMRWHATFMEKCLRRSYGIQKARLGGVPYSASQEELLDNIQQTRDSMYANYRYYPELLETGWLSQEDALSAIEYRERHQGECAGMTLLRYRPDGPLNIDNWPIAAYGRALLEYGQKERFMKLLGTLFTNNMCPDVFTAYENESVEDNPRHPNADFCVPVQLVFPRLLAWSFSYTKWNGETVAWDGPIQNSVKL